MILSQLFIWNYIVFAGSYRGPSGYDPRSRAGGAAATGDPRAAANVVAAGGGYGTDAGRAGFPAGHPSAANGPIGRSNPPSSVTIPPNMAGAGANPNEQEKTKLIMQVCG